MFLDNCKFLRRTPSQIIIFENLKIVKEFDSFQRMMILDAKKGSNGITVIIKIYEIATSRCS